MSQGDGAAEADPRPPSIFLSYSRGDRPIAVKLVAALEAAGCSVWWDGLLEGGVAFANQTEQALENADAVVVLWSAISVDSHWVRDEATHGRERGRLVPVTIDGTFPPLGFRQYQLIDMSRWKGRPGAPEVADLVRAVHLAQGQSTAPPPPPQLRSSPVSRRNAMIGGGAALAVAAGGAAYWRFGLGGGGGEPANSVAVIPFRNLSGDPGQGWFSEGLSEEIRLALSRNTMLRVMAPSSANAAREADSSPKGIARKLGVAYLLDGSVRASGEKLRIGASLINGASGFAEWEDQFDRPRGDVFAIQSEIANAVARAMSAQVANLSAKRRDSGPGGTSSVKAHDAYLRGNAYYEMRTGEASSRAALAQYDAAIKADPDYAQAHAARARVITAITNNYARAEEFAAAYGDAIASARRAVSLAPDLAIAQATLGFVLVQGKLDIKGAKGPYEKAGHLGQGDADVQRLYAAYAAQIGDRPAAAAAIALSVERDPLNPAAYRTRGYVEYCARDYNKSVSTYRRALELNPKIAQANALLGDALFQLGQYGPARQAYESDVSKLLGLTGLAIVEQRLGNTESASNYLASLQSEFGDGSSYQQAQILAQWGDIAASKSRLLLAERVGDIGLSFALVDPMLDSLRQDQEFSRLLNRLGFG